MKLFHYTYEIRHKTTNKKYIGSRSSNDLPLFDLLEYKSSSKDKDFKKELNTNQENFEFKILDVFNTRIEATSYEIYLHSKFDVAKNPNYYNNAKQTSIGFYFGGHSEETKRGMSNSRRGSGNSMFGKNHSDESKEKMSQNRKGTKLSKEQKENLSLKLKGLN